MTSSNRWGVAYRRVKRWRDCGKDASGDSMFSSKLAVSKVTFDAKYPGMSCKA